MKAARGQFDLRHGTAHWLAEGLIAWPRRAFPLVGEPSQFEWHLQWAPDGGIDPFAPEPVAWQSARLVPFGDDLPEGLACRFPHLSEAIALAVPEGLDVAEILKCQIAVFVSHLSGSAVLATGVQTAAVLDELYPDAQHADLGATWRDGVPTLRVWAPTARSASLLLWPPDSEADAPPERLPMEPEPDGCWALTGDASWRAHQYLYEVDVFAPSFLRRVRNQVTDPYSVALTCNSTRSVLYSLDDPELQPEAWPGPAAPALEHPCDQVIYELHVRDYSMADPEIPQELAGTYAAFTHPGAGERHLAQLRDAGLTTVQLLPIFDCGTLQEDRDLHRRPDLDYLRSLPPDSDEQQRHVCSPEARGIYNWGYDPWHYQAPEGSYATSRDPAARVREVRAMIMALHGMGLRVVLDQVYNHTDSADQAVTSVLGKLVPGYYHRRDEAGYVATSSCCPNLATEHRMAEKLMIESVVLWARHYRVDGFRFDLMGHHSRANMVAVREALDALTPERDGIDGRGITMHGEGWDFGEVADNARFLQATQGQLGGTRIATFSDRLRDAVRGGRPFDTDPREQGFGTGLFTAPNETYLVTTDAAQQEALLRAHDLIQLGLAGNLRSMTFTSAVTGRLVRGDEIRYAGVPAGYADEPEEVVTYVDAHDNETLFDALTLKLPPSVPMSERVRANTLCLALASYAQTPVMWHAGSDFLRSKSFDRNSYASGDWFNQLDFTLHDNGFAAGLPPAPDNAAVWHHLRPLLADPKLKPAPKDMMRAHRQALDVLRVRSSSRLFRLGSAERIRAKVSFPVSGTYAQIPGVIVMHLDDTVGEPVDERWAGIVVIFNGAGWPVRQSVPKLGGRPWTLHPVQAAGHGRLVRKARCDDGVFAIPGRTAAVFVSPR